MRRLALVDVVRSCWLGKGFGGFSGYFGQRGFRNCFDEFMRSWAGSENDWKALWHQNHGHSLFQLLFMLLDWQKRCAKEIASFVS